MNVHTAHQLLVGQNALAAQLSCFYFA